MSIDTAFRQLRDANPVPTPGLLRERRPDPAAFLATTQQRSRLMQTQQRPEVQAAPPLEPKRGRLIAAAVAAVVAAVAIGAVALIINQDDGDPVTVNPDAARVAAAIGTSETFLAAINSGDVDRLVEMSNPEATDLIRDRNMWEMNAVLTTGGYEYVVGACASLVVTELFVDVGCDVTVTDPVFAAEGVDTLVFPLRVFNDGTTVWQPMQGGNISAVNQDYADYLKAFHTSEYEAVCAPSAYQPGSIVFDRGLALTGDCARLFVPLAPDVADWVRNGKP